jgi:hypothetical protein
MFDFDTRGILTKVVVAFPIPRRSDRSGHKTPAAIWADVLKDFLDARGAERALIGANARFKRIRKQRLVAIFTGRSEFKHAALNQCVC